MKTKFNGKELIIPKEVCKFYHDHLEYYMHIYNHKSMLTTDEVHAKCVLEALALLLEEPLIDRQFDPTVHPVQLKLDL